MEDLISLGGCFYTPEEIALLDTALACLKRNDWNYGIYAHLERQSQNSGAPRIASYMIDAYLVARGEKRPDEIIPPATLAGGYGLVAKMGRKGTILPQYFLRPDGALLYMEITWGTTAPAEGWRRYAWFRVESFSVYQRVSGWGPIATFIQP